MSQYYRMATATLERFTETTLCESALTVDRESGVIRGVKILGAKSKNGREYTRKAMESAAKLYRDATVNLNHPDRSNPTVERKFEDGIGWFESTEVRTDGVYGDLALLKEHSQFGSVCESAERSPKRFGLSHNAEGHVEHRDGNNVVEDVEAVYSVDIVRNPATNAGLFESEEPVMKKTTIKKLVEDAAKSQAGFKRVLMEMEEGGMLDPAAEMDAEASAAEAVVEKLADKAREVFVDPNIDPKETGRKVAELAKAAEDVKAKLDSTDEAEPPADKPAEESEAMESLQRKMDRLEAKNALLESGVDATEARITAVAAVPESQRKALVESWEPSKGETKQKPRSGSVLIESDDTGYSRKWDKILESATP